MLAQAHLIPGQEQWFHSAVILFVRMSLAAILMGLVYHKQLRVIGLSEIRQGLALGVFGGVGMLFQTDAQHFIPASTSAFFTQFTCIFLPLVIAFRSRAWPSGRVAVSCLLVLAGCAILSGISSEGLSFGRGEWETIIAAALFTGQILVLEKACYRSNEMRSAATVMFATKALVLAPVILIAGSGHASGAGATGFELWSETLCAFSSGPVLLMTALLTVFSTVYGYATMTRWQPLVSPVQAGMIYATEPIFATLWALFLPGWFSSIGGISYANEVLGGAFFAGAALILGANVLALGTLAGGKVPTNTARGPA